MKDAIITKVNKIMEDNKDKDTQLKKIKEEIRALKVENERLKDDG